MGFLDYETVAKFFAACNHALDGRGAVSSLKMYVCGRSEQYLVCNVQAIQYSTSS